MQPIRRYWFECLVALRIGASIPDKLRIAGAAVAFHLRTRHRRGIDRAPSRYRVRLIGRSHDLWLRTYAGDMFVFFEIFLSDCYRIPDFDYARCRLIVDLGANVGLSSLFFASLAPTTLMICVEPSPANADLLRRNLADVPGAVVIEAALAAETGRRRFDDDKPAWGGAVSKDGRIEVASIAMTDLLDQYAAGERVDLLKVDIEGGEEELFSGDLGWLDRVDRVIAELHPPFAFERFRGVFEARGFDTYDAGESGHALPTAVRRGL